MDIQVLHDSFHTFGLLLFEVCFDVLPHCIVCSLVCVVLIIFILFIELFELVLYLLPRAGHIHEVIETFIPHLLVVAWCPVLEIHVVLGLDVAKTPRDLFAVRAASLS